MMLPLQLDPLESSLNDEFSLRRGPLAVTGKVSLASVFEVLVQHCFPSLLAIVPQALVVLAKTWQNKLLHQVLVRHGTFDLVPSDSAAMKLEDLLTPINDRLCEPKLTLSIDA